MITSRYAALGLASIVLTLGTGCARPSHSPSPSPAAAAPLQCERGYAATVANNTPREVDIVQFTSGQWAYLASVAARTTRELPLANNGRVEWRWPPQPQQYDPNLSVDVTVHMHCV
jgi:hypothetical protein